MSVHERTIERLYPSYIIHVKREPRPVGEAERGHDGPSGHGVREAQGVPYLMCGHGLELSTPVAVEHPALVLVKVGRPVLGWVGMA